MIPVEDHLDRALSAVRPLDPIDVALLDALDCVLAEDVVSTATLPAFDNSAMDGYAVHLPDVAEASEESPVVLPVVADLAAGAREAFPLTPGSAVRIMTGAPVPPRTGAVVPVEWTDGGIAQVRITRAPRPDQNIRRAGEDVTPGEVLLSAGTRLAARHLGLLAAAGHDRVRVRPRPRVVVLSTGSELVEPGRPLGFGQIHESNGYALTAAALDAGAAAVHGGIVPDDPRVLMSTLEDHLGRADLLITTGGVSMGAYDTVKEVLSQLGTVTFSRVAMQPGMPQGFGTLGPDATPIFTLPGNPVSSYVSFEVFVRPVLRKMMGESQLHRPSVTATVTEGWTSVAGKRQFVRVELTTDEQGRSVCRPVGGHGSHLVADLAVANALAVVPEDTTRVVPGDTVRCLLLERGRR
ncbi:molybdopterin molybdotransferase MoeA [Kineosporiaceae bacterium SCSIO 59966]|nr:molybdopterin molybdotransferase MoeA [Kineosporiaceae bacterium SCSIO 59966]